MLKWVHSLANPNKLYLFCGRLLWVFTPLGILITSIALFWGLAIAPADYQQGEAYRIMYIHVPAAILSLALYSTMAVSAFVGVVWQIKAADLTAMATAPIGAIFTLMALVTGSLWGKPMWGTWWVWDARLTSELILLLIYAGIIALYHAFDDRRLAARAAGMLVLIGCINLPIIHYSVEWWNTLHQGSSQMQQSISPLMRLPLRLSILGFMSIAATFILMNLRFLILQMEQRRTWVITLATKGGRK
ncbi:heme ABC transporter permease [Scandinavium manionii]|uniref:heme ABC transporter permease n=1 Tax=Scandinavium manionii TaxID=2926520 RepID=UPI001359ADE9|nr:heme ABC transporter permease [Scandinavium manionii]MCS2164227.1 heme ABC transporter permease [Scandinavium manionii]